jgi:hypothetical protein
MRRRLSMRHVAGFTMSDPDVLVVASLACQACLRRPVVVLVDADVHCPSALAHCPDCEEPTQVMLRPDQLVRLAALSLQDLTIQVIT